MNSMNIIPALRSSQSPNNEQQTRAASNNAHIKRPLNSFMIWAQLRRKEISLKNPKLHNSEISKQLGMEWKNVPEEEKYIYKRRANQLREEHQEAYPNYKYNPRRKPKRKSKKEPILPEPPSNMNSHYLNNTYEQPNNSYLYHQPPNYYHHYHNHVPNNDGHSDYNILPNFSQVFNCYGPLVIYHASETAPDLPVLPNPDGWMAANDTNYQPADRNIYQQVDFNQLQQQQQQQGQQQQQQNFNPPQYINIEDNIFLQL